MRYRVDLEELLAFVERLQAFEQQAEGIAARVERQVADLHTAWLGSGADAHRARHDEWMAAATQMREAGVQLKAAARHAHRNYTDAAQSNLDMLR